MAVLPTNTVPVASGVEDIDTKLTAAASGGDNAEVGSGKFLVVKNGGTGNRTITIATPGTRSGLAVSDGVYDAPAGKYTLVPLADVFRGANGRAAITYDAVTSVTVGVFELGS
ncbi:hypothetical protein SUDANB15_02545 [Streptomyces sp. enrichment culture]|uniref:hypothetical protein n=1 Tax=Streptomyces sp. enrichment culture TaxID=1795815 RepID=UPI003F569E42